MGIWKRRSTTRRVRRKGTLIVVLAQCEIELIQSRVVGLGELVHIRELYSLV
jgi:hypothetical protein